MVLLALPALHQHLVGMKSPQPKKFIGGQSCFFAQRPGLFDLCLSVVLASAKAADIRGGQTWPVTPRRKRNLTCPHSWGAVFVCVRVCVCMCVRARGGQSTDCGDGDSTLLPGDTGPPFFKRVEQTQ